MICKKCGYNLNENDKYCNNCGNLAQENMINNEYMEGYQTNNDIDFNEKFIKAYIGKKADKMYQSVKNGGINIWSILFGVGYFAYRKMYLIAIIAVLVGNAIGYIIPIIGEYFGTFLGFMFCPLYKWDITRKLKKIKENNPTLDETQLLKIAENKGGTSLVGAILFIVIYLIVIIFI